jgi:3-methylcrotonyl-CoA carboxylase alpha subunit
LRQMLNKVLIANRGECAVRIAKTCERMGIHSIAIYGERDQASLHVQVCEEAHRIDPGLAGEPYFNGEAILQTAKSTGAEAVHPGYGLLSESPSFVRAVRGAGLIFVGPSAEALEMLSDELSAREVAKRAGVRPLPAIDFKGASYQQLLRDADLIGYPIAVKRAASGGGGKGQIVNNRAQLERALAPFLDSHQALLETYRVYVEKHIERHRRVEVEVIADERGEYIALGERECSVQLHDRKLVEESPAPALTGLFVGDLKRSILWDSAIRIAQEAGFTNLGSAEFLVDADGRLFFRRFIPRLQVGHQLTELCTGLNLVELQLLLASGEPLPPEVRRAQSSGHAMQARISTLGTDDGVPIGYGKVKELRWPSVGRGKLKFETNLYVGAELDYERNPWLARAATYGSTRHEAMLTLDRTSCDQCRAIARSSRERMLSRRAIRHDLCREATDHLVRLASAGRQTQRTNGLTRFFFHRPKDLLYVAR